MIYESLLWIDKVWVVVRYGPEHERHHAQPESVALEKIYCPLILCEFQSPAVPTTKLGLPVELV